MSKPVTGLTTFANQSPPWSLASLDANFASITAALNDLGTYSNPLQDSSGTANIITCTTAPGITVSYAKGLLVYVQVANTNTSSAVTLNINSLGAMNVGLPNTSLLSAGQLQIGTIYGFLYTGASWAVLNVQPLFTISTSGIVPQSPGGTADFLRADGNWALPTSQGFFNATVSGITGVSSIPCNYVTCGPMVTFCFSGGPYTGTSNSSNFQISGIPNAIQPQTITQYSPVTSCMDNGAPQGALIEIPNLSSTWTVVKLNQTSWTSSGQKGFPLVGQVFSYLLL